LRNSLYQEHQRDYDGRIKWEVAVRENGSRSHHQNFHTLTGVARLKKPKETRRLASAARNFHAFTSAAQLNGY
jgi:hypothetical protein